MKGVLISEDLLRQLIGAAEHAEHPTGDGPAVGEARALLAGPSSEHRLELTLDVNGVTSKLVCPPTGCEPVEQCSECGRRRGDKENEPCSVCTPDTEGECWLRTWAEAEELTDHLHDDTRLVVTVPIEAEFDGEGPIVSFPEDGEE